jgi:hypothetical protein
MDPKAKATAAASGEEMSDKYILDGTKPVLEPDLMKWAKWFETANRRVAQSQINNVRISTVFLGLDHSWNGPPPLLFETMVFGGKHDELQKRCSTWEEAEKQHNAACDLVRENP